MKNRLIFFKKLYPKYLVFIKSKNKLKLNDIDNKILDFINNHKGYKVNYVIFVNLDIIKCKNYEFNDVYFTCYCCCFIIFTISQNVYF